MPSIDGRGSPLLPRSESTASCPVLLLVRRNESSCSEEVEWGLSAQMSSPRRRVGVHSEFCMLELGTGDVLQLGCTALRAVEVGLVRSITLAYMRRQTTIPLCQHQLQHPNGRSRSVVRTRSPRAGLEWLLKDTVADDDKLLLAPISALENYRQQQRKQNSDLASDWQQNIGSTFGSHTTVWLLACSAIMRA